MQHFTLALIVRAAGLGREHEPQRADDVCARFLARLTESEARRLAHLIGASLSPPNPSIG
jgi:hypothetical protein